MVLLRVEYEQNLKMHFPFRVQTLVPFQNYTISEENKMRTLETANKV